MTSFICVIPPCASGILPCCSSQDLTQGTDMLFWAERDVDPHCYVSIRPFFALAVSLVSRSASTRTDANSSMHAGGHIPIQSRQQHCPDPDALLLEQYVPHYMRLVPVTTCSQRLLIRQHYAQLLPLLHIRRGQLRRREQRGQLHERCLQEYTCFAFTTAFSASRSSEYSTLYE